MILIYYFTFNYFILFDFKLLIIFKIYLFELYVYDFDLHSYVCSLKKLFDVHRGQKGVSDTLDLSYIMLEATASASLQGT